MSRTFLVIGAGGREHAIAWKLAQARDRPTVLVAPGNDGVDADPDIEGCVELDVSDFDAVAAFARERDVTLTVVGPEAPLCDGIVDHFEAEGLPIFGPVAAAAHLEASKAFAKEIMDAAGVPTAAWASFDALEDALAYARQQPHPLVIKADGLAGGKGVVICPDLATTEATLTEFMRDERFGQASASVVLEECLTGPELSFMVVTDGEAVLPLSTSQDHKRLLDGDQGPNTGGMGAFTPSHHATPALEQQLLDEVIQPTLRELARRGVTYRGFLYAGLMLTSDGPRVLEFNCRLGDPETQALVTAMECDLDAVLERVARGALAGAPTLRTDRAAFCVVMASDGYPRSPRKGFPITGIEQADARAGVKVFHAGTRRDGDLFVNAGGRVLGVTAVGEDLADARARAYEAAALISWRGVHYRRDLGADFAGARRPDAERAGPSLEE